MNKYLDDFMKTFPFEGLTYDDVTLVTQYADFLPDETSLETKLTSRTSAYCVTSVTSSYVKPSNGKAFMKSSRCLFINSPLFINP